MRAGSGMRTGARRARRAATASALVLAIGGLLASGALAATSRISWTIPAPRIDAGAKPRATFTVRIPRGTSAVLQHQVRRVWVTVAALHPRPDGRGSVSAPRVGQGVHPYRIAVVGGNRRVVAHSRALLVFAYAKVALATIVGRGTQVLDVAGQSFTYAVGVFATDPNGGVADAPGFDRLVAMGRTTCRSISLALGAPIPNAGESGGTLAISIVQGNANPATAQLTGGQIAGFSAPLTGAAWELHASSLLPATDPNGGSHALDIAVNGSLSCYTPSGR
jgi:hypothetical protein